MLIILMSIFSFDEEGYFIHIYIYIYCIKKKRFRTIVEKVSKKPIANKLFTSSLFQRKKKKKILERIENVVKKGVVCVILIYNDLPLFSKYI